jgi:hypothetical protein
VVDAVAGATAHTDNPMVLDGDVHGVTVRVEHRGRLSPAIDVAFFQSLLEMHVNRTGQA